MANNLGAQSVRDPIMGRSDWEKPILPASRHGHVYYEVDTGNVFMWDGPTLSWVPQ